MKVQNANVKQNVKNFVIEVPFEVDPNLIGIIFNLLREEGYDPFKIHKLAVLALLPRSELMD